MILATYLGLAIAASLLGVATVLARAVLTVSEPRACLLAIPLVTMYFAVVGLRAASAVPVDLDANWPLRMHEFPVETPAAATRLFLLLLGVLPVMAGAAAAAVWLWGAKAAVALALVQGAAGALLVEIVLSSSATVPFASAHEPAVSTLRFRWSWHAGAVLFFGYALAAIESKSLPSVMATAALLAALVVCFSCAAVLGRRARARRSVTFEAASESLNTLRLSPELD